MRSEKIERSKQILAKLFLPILKLQAVKKHDAYLAQKLSEGPPLLDENTLRQTWLFSNWNTYALKAVLDRSKLKAFGCGKVVGLEGEPRKHLSVFYVVSGKVSQIPTKKEIRALSLYFPEATDVKYHPRDPLRWFGFKNFEQEELAGTSASISRDLLLGSLHVYKEGQLVDTELLLLGAPFRSRSLRCLTDCVLLEIPFDAILTEFSLLKPHPRQVALDKARLIGCTNLSKGNEKPSYKDIIKYNQILQGLRTGTVETTWIRLRPYLFTKGEVICTDVYNSNMVYFLKSGQVSITSSNSKETKVIQQCAAHVGLDTFMVHNVPSCLGDHHMAVARCFCILWGINVSDLSDLCSKDELLSCSLLASKMVRHKCNRLDIAGCLRKLVAFAPLTNDCLEGIARGLEVRVYPPGKRIVTRGILKEGVIVLVGKCAFDKISENERHITCGEPLYFCESLLGMAAPKSILAKTSSMVLHCSPKVILDAVQAFDNASDITNVLRLANEYVVSKYNLDVSKTGMARQRAAERVCDAKRKKRTLGMIHEKERMAKTMTKKEDDFVGEAIMGNNFLVNLTLQLESLQYNEDQAQRYRLLEETSLPNKQCIGHTNTNEHGHDFFTISNDGEIIFCEQSYKANKKIQLEPLNPTAKGKIKKPQSILYHKDDTSFTNFRCKTAYAKVVKSMHSPIASAQKSPLDRSPLQKKLPMDPQRRTITFSNLNHKKSNSKVDLRILMSKSYSHSNVNFA